MKYNLEDVFKLEECFAQAADFDNIARTLVIRDELYFPNYKLSPWHVQWKPADDIEVNFWPHKCKGHIAYTKGPAAKGHDELRDLIWSVLDTLQERDDDEDEDVIE